MRAPLTHVGNDTSPTGATRAAEPLTDNVTVAGKTPRAAHDQPLLCKRASRGDRKTCLKCHRHSTVTCTCGIIL